MTEWLYTPSIKAAMKHDPNPKPLLAYQVHKIKDCPKCAGTGKVKSVVAEGDENVAPVTVTEPCDNCDDGEVLGDPIPGKLLFDDDQETVLADDEAVGEPQTWYKVKVVR